MPTSILCSTLNSPSRKLHFFAASQELKKLSETYGDRHNVSHGSDGLRYCLALERAPLVVGVLYGWKSVFRCYLIVSLILGDFPRVICGIVPVFLPTAKS